MATRIAKRRTGYFHIFIKVQLYQAAVGLSLVEALRPVTTASANLVK